MDRVGGVEVGRQMETIGKDGGVVVRQTKGRYGLYGEKVGVCLSRNGLTTEGREGEGGRPWRLFTRVAAAIDAGEGSLEIALESRLGGLRALRCF